MKVTGGVLRVKDLVTNRRPGVPEERVWSEKADQLRVYSGAKFRPVDQAPAGAVVMVSFPRITGATGLPARVWALTP